MKGDNVAARSLTEEALALFRAMGDKERIASSLPVTVFAFARKNGLLVWRVAPELTSVETM